MAWKMDGDSIAIKDGNPVWVYEDGKEAGFNAETALKNLDVATAESVVRKKKLKELEEKYKPLADIEDVSDFFTKATAAIDTVKNFDDKKFVDAKEVETLKLSVAKTYDDKIKGMETAWTTKEKEYQESISSKDTNISNLLIKGEIGRSQFIGDKTVLTPSIAFDVFKGNFQIEESDGHVKAVATRADGTRIMSLKDPGSYAGIDEALETLVTEHPDSARLVKGNPGGGGTPPGGGGGGNDKSISRSQFEKMDPVAQGNHVRGGGTVTD